MTLTESHILAWLKNTSTLEDASAKNRLVDLISIIEGPEAEPPSKQYTFYSDQVRKVMAELGSAARARQFVLDTYVIDKTNSVPSVASYYPALREYVGLYRKTPELLVVLFSYSGAVGETQNAGNWLKEASEMDPDNEFVLWQRILSRGVPWFPKELILSSDVLEEEIWLLGRLLQRNPFDLLASGVHSHLRETGRSLMTTENIGFLNSLRRVAPHPMTHMSFVLMIEGPKPKHLSHTDATRRIP